MKAQRFGALLALLASVSCADPEFMTRVGIISFDGDTRDVISAPDTVRVLEPFAVTVTTFGSGGCTEAAGALVNKVSPLMVSVTPRDRQFIPGPGEACTGDIRFLHRSVILTFGQPGTGIIRIEGVSLSSVSGERTPLTVEQTVVVLP